MRKFFGVFGDLFLFNSRFDAGKHFYDNAFIGHGSAITKHKATVEEFLRTPFS